VDEVGRGCLAGPVFAAAVILDPNKPILGLADSKKLTEKKRTLLAEQIKQSALCWSIGRAEASEIDQINILQASLLAMQRAISQLEYAPDYVLVDGNRLPKLACEGETVVGGDALIAEISAASILAKVARDAEMHLLDRLYPHYEFAVHKAYPTAKHREKLQQWGVCKQHRLTFAPVKKFLA
jgi:ribonuclease HII